MIERHPPHGAEALEWMLLTSLHIDSFETAIEKIRWYCLRWRIEVFHKILKSGMKIEECRLATASRLICYLSVMSIVAWGVFWLTLFSRENPESPCTTILSDEEWKVLYSKLYRHQSLPSKIPSLKEASVWIARLGGFLERKGDGSPGSSLTTDLNLCPRFHQYGRIFASFLDQHVQQSSEPV
ncbi:MAG: IS4 family transposase [Oligoflexales bacterium]|nr:IS4 family transposase [Oligoflexales bacterium]